MGKVGIILIFAWLGCRFLLHSTIFGDTGVLYALYFNSSNLPLVGFFCVLYDLVKRTKYRPPYIKVGRFRKLILVSIIYSIWCLAVDNLIMASVGAHDSSGYTISSMLIIITGIVWVIYV